MYVYRFCSFSHTFSITQQWCYKTYKTKYFEIRHVHTKMYIVSLKTSLKNTAHHFLAAVHSFFNTLGSHQSSVAVLAIIESLAPCEAVVGMPF